MTDQADIPLLQAGLPDPSKIPTSPLALEMLSTIYLTAAVAYITYGLRMYSKIAFRQTGLGKQEDSAFDLGCVCISVLTFRPLHRGLADYSRHGSLPPLYRNRTFLTLNDAQIVSMGYMSVQYRCKSILKKRGRYELTKVRTQS